MTIFLIIIGIIFLGLILVRFSDLEINIKDFELLDLKINKFDLEFSLKLFDKFKWVKFRLDNKKFEKLKNSPNKKVFDKILNTNLFKNFKNASKTTLNILKLSRENAILKSFNLYSKIGLESAPTTAFVIGVISSILGIILARKIKKPTYKIEPLYLNKNYIYLSLNCIISLKLVHIINMKKPLKGKEVYHNYGRNTSNRGSYASSHG